MQAIDIFMSSCLVFVFLSLIEYALVNIILGDIVESEEGLAKHSGVRSSVFAHTSKLLYKNVSIVNETLQSSGKFFIKRPPQTADYCKFGIKCV